MLTTTAGFFTGLVDVICAIYDFSFYVVTAARAGRTLPRLTIVAVLHLSVLTATMIGPKQQPLLGDDRLLLLLKALSNWCLAVNVCLHVVGYTLLVLLYRHSVQTIFNRTLPKTFRKSVPSFGAHLALLRPLELVARFFTAPWRALPDILVLGEVRCGTTTLCQHLSSLNIQGPFCLWAHPELDHKESFYWMGHYLGYVSPYLYRMCFSWNYNRGVLNNNGTCSFDGCAQYLTSPTAPHLIAHAYRQAGQPPPILIACVRNPVDQAMSWWNYEQAAMQWGTSMKLTEWNTSLRSSDYPPKTLMTALDFSSSDFVEDSYGRAEQLVENCHSLPPWAMTWPAGQLGAIGRSGMYASNIDRYERVFGATFGNHQASSQTTVSQRACRYPMGSKYQYMNVIALDDLKNETTLKVALTSIMEQLSERRQEMARLEQPSSLFSRLKSTCFPQTNSQHTDPHHNAMLLSHLRTVKRNPSNPNTMTQATKEDQIRLAKLFAKDSKCLKDLCGVSFSEQ